MAPSRRHLLESMGATGAAVIAGCLGDEGPDAEGGSAVSGDGTVVAEVDPGEVTEHETFDRFDDNRAHQVEDGSYEIAVSEIDFVFILGSMDPIMVPDDSEVTFYLASRDSTHGFGIVGKDVSLELPPGTIVETTVEFDADDQRTTYEIVCSEAFCEQPGQEEMIGEIHVVPDTAEFE